MAFGRGDVAARLRALNVRVAKSATVLGLRRQLLLRLVARRDELAAAEPPVTPKRTVTVRMDEVCALCGADRQPGGYAANGFPVKHRLCERCGLACVGMYSGIGAVSSPFFAGMVDACVKNAAGFLVERDAFEKTPDANGGGTAGATAAQSAAVAAVIAQFRRTEERAEIAKMLVEGETHDVLKGQRPLDPQHTELRRDAALLRSNELDLRELKDAIGKECTDETRALLEGQFARLAATHAREKHRLEVLAEPGLGLDTVRWSERDARAAALTCDTDTPEQAVLRAAEYKKRMDAHAKKRKVTWKAPWQRGGGGGGGGGGGRGNPGKKKPGKTGKPGGKPTKKQRTGRGGGGGGGGAAANAAPKVNTVTAGTDGKTITKAGIHCFICGHRGHYSGKCPDA